jgi:hypothetical protein
MALKCLLLSTMPRYIFVHVLFLSGYLSEIWGWKFFRNLRIKIYPKIDDEKLSKIWGWKFIRKIFVWNGSFVKSALGRWRRGRRGGSRGCRRRRRLCWWKSAYWRHRRPRSFTVRFARFFLKQYTKTRGKYTKLPQFYQVAVNFTKRQ